MRTMTEVLCHDVLCLVHRVQVAFECDAVYLIALNKLLDESGWALSLHQLFEYLEEYQDKGWLIIQTYKGAMYPNYTVMITEAGISQMKRLSE